MKYFPITILDDFYDNPDEILKLAKEVDYQREGENTYPGCVSNLTVDKIDYNLFFFTMKKIISMYWEGECNENFEVTMQFQLAEYTTTVLDHYTVTPKTPICLRLLLQPHVHLAPIY